MQRVTFERSLRMPLVLLRMLTVLLSASALCAPCSGRGGISLSLAVPARLFEAASVVAISCGVAERGSHYGLVGSFESLRGGNVALLEIDHIFRRRKEQLYIFELSDAWFGGAKRVLQSRTTKYMLQRSLFAVCEAWLVCAVLHCACILLHMKR